MTAARIELIHELVSAAAAAVPHQPAIVTPDGTAWPFELFDAQVGSVAAWVSERTRPGARVAVIADNGPSYARLYYAVPRSGRILVLINQRLSPGEQVTQLAMVQPTILVGDADHLAALPDITTTVPGLESVVTFADPEWQRAEHDSGSTTAAVEPDDPAWLLFTSGSTGTPKAVLHSHRSLTTAVRGTVAGRSVRSGGLYLLPFPMCHVAGYNMLVHHAVRSAVMPVPAFRPHAFVEAVNANGVTSCSLAPTMLHALLAYLDATGLSLPTLRDVSYGSSAIPADLLRRALDRLDVGFHQGYGMTETGGNVTFLGPAEHRAGAAGDAALLGTAGRPHDAVEIRIAPGGATAGIGEIMIRGAQVTVGYWPHGTPVTADGWLPTGDVGRIDDDGRLVVLDRSRDVIITGGENVSSREVEDVLSSHDGVDQVAVVGVPDAYWGEAICAVVVAGTDEPPDADDLIAHVRARLAAFKRPRHVLFVDALPLTTNGKIAKDAVRRDARARLVT